MVTAASDAMKTPRLDSEDIRTQSLKELESHLDLFSNIKIEDFNFFKPPQK